MINSLSEDLKKIFLAGVGAVAVTAEKSKELVDELIKKGELTVEQGKVLNEELKNDIKDKFKDGLNITIIKNEGGKTVDSVYEDVKSLSKEELAALKAKLEQLEQAE